MKHIFYIMLLAGLLAGEFSGGSIIAEETAMNSTMDSNMDSTNNGNQMPAQGSNLPPDGVSGNVAAPNSKQWESENSITRMLSATDGLEKNSDRIESTSGNLTMDQKYTLMNQYKKDNTMPFLINFLVGFGIGSFVQGDTTGGLTALIGDLASEAVLFTGYFMTIGSVYTFSSFNPVGLIMLIAGSVSMIGFRIYELVRPWTFAKEYNAKLEKSLQLSVVVTPYMNLAETLGPVYGAALTAHF